MNSEKYAGARAVCLVMLVMALYAGVGVWAVL